MQSPIPSRCNSERVGAAGLIIPRRSSRLKRSGSRNRHPKQALTNHPTLSGLIGITFLGPLFKVMGYPPPYDRQWEQGVVMGIFSKDREDIDYRTNENKLNAAVAQPYAQKFWDAGNQIVLLVYAAAFGFYIVVAQYPEARGKAVEHVLQLVGLALGGNVLLTILLVRLAIRPEASVPANRRIDSISSIGAGSGVIPRSDKSTWMPKTRSAAFQ
jgi:hypothetical protein